MRARDPSADRTEGHTRTPLSAQTFGPDLRDDLHADERSLPRRHRGRPTTKDVRRATSPLDASVPVNVAGGAHGNCPVQDPPEVSMPEVACTRSYWDSLRVSISSIVATWASNLVRLRRTGAA